MNLPKGSILSVAAKNEYDPATPGTATWHPLSEHARTPLAVSIERIENTTRMANGSLRKWWIADKRTFSTSWEGLPHTSTFTVDGKWGGAEMETFFNANWGDCWAQIREPSGSTTVYAVVIKSFGKTVTKRGRYEFWDIDLALEEI
jgi:hypothetical protein